MKRIAKIETRCVACGTCVPYCIKQAIRIEHGVKAVVNQQSCVGCGLCAKQCPAGIIHIVESGVQ